MKLSLGRAGLSGCMLFLFACQQSQPPDAISVTQPRAVPRSNGQLPLADLKNELQLTDLRLCFGKYLVGTDAEGYVSVFYKPSPDSSWVSLPQADGQQVELDTANIDRAGEPELVLTKEYKRSGNPDQGTVKTLYIIRIGPKPETLLTTMVACSDYHHAWEVPHDVYDLAKEQPISTGYGFISVGPVQTTCNADKPLPSCDCDQQDIVEAGSPRFTRPGIYRWQQRGLVWSGAPLPPTHRSRE